LKALLLTAFIVALFFGLALYSIRREERRSAERRRGTAISTPDQRKQDRRQGGAVAYLGWALRALRSTFTR